MGNRGQWQLQEDGSFERVVQRPNGSSGGNGAVFAVCDSAGDAAVKSVVLGTFLLRAGAGLHLLFANVNTVENIQLSINGGPGKPILFDGVAPEVGDLARGQIYSLMYSGAAWQILAGMARDRIGQTVWFEDTLQRPGYVPLNGCTIENFSQLWPQMAAYLATAHGQARCFATLAEREAAHVAIWHTLASGATVGWDGFGGVCKFFYDAENDILYLPDLRGMFRAMAGDGVVAPSMAGSKGDTTRNITGEFAWTSGELSTWNSNYITVSGALTIIRKTGKSPQNNTASDGGVGFGIDAGLAVPTGAVNSPRSWGALACCYLGHPATG